MNRLLVPLLVLLMLISNIAVVLAAPPPQYTVQGSVNLAPSSPQLTAVDPFANVVSSPDGLKPARPFWYSVNKTGLTILRVYDNVVVSTVPWPQTIDVVQPDGSFLNVPAPPGGWEPVGVTVSYPTDEALASNSETPAAYVYVVMAHSGYEWQTATTLPAGRDPNLRDTLVPSTNPATESSMLVQIDVTDPSFSAAPPALAGAILGHGAGQPAYDPATGNVYVGNIPSTSLPTTPAVPNDLTSFISVVAPLAPPVAEAAAGVVAAPEPPMVVVCGPEHPEDGVLAGVPIAWACVSSGDGPSSWEFTGLPAWLKAHPDKLTGQLDGIIYGTPVVGTYTFQARVTDYGDPEAGPLTSDWATYTLIVTTTAPSEEGEGGFEAGVAMAQAIQGTGLCTPAATASPGSVVPAWVDVATVPGGCVVLGTAPISGEYYEFALPNFQFLYPFDREPVIFSGNVAGPYVFDPLPAGVGLSGMAWHQIEKLHDPSTEADILNVELIGIEPYTGQLYRILPPQGAIEGSVPVLAPPETSIEGDTITPEGTPLVTTLTGARTDIAAALVGDLKIRFGNVAVEADRDIFVTAGEISDPTGVDPTIIPIGGPAGAALENGAIVKVSGGNASTINLPGVQAVSLGLNSDLRPGIPGSEPGQTDNGALIVTGTNTGNVAVLNTTAGTIAQSLVVTDATSLGGVAVDPVSAAAYIAVPALQSVSIFSAGSAPANRAPVIWGGAGAAGIELTFSENVAGSATITATGWPTPTLSLQGTLPAGVTFTNNGNGTATLAGTPAAGSAATFSLTITATNGILPNDTEALTLIVNPPTAPPAITSANTATFVAGSPGTFNVTTTGGPIPTLTYTGTLPSGVTFTGNEDGTATLAGTPSAGSEGSYTFTITAANATLPDAIQNFTLVVSAPGTATAPAVTTQPATQTVAEGQAVTFLTAASGIPTPTVQWQVSTNSGSTFTDIVGAVGTSYSIPAPTATINGYQYRAVFTNSVGSVTSNAATLTVTVLPPVGTAPVVTTQPLSQTVTEGQAVTFSAAASGDPAPTVQWQESANSGTTFTNIAGATSTSYTIPATTAALTNYQYRAVFSNSAGSATSNAAILSVILLPPVNTAPVVTTQPSSQTITEGQAVTFSAAATGTPAPTVQWQQSTNSGSTFTNIAGATAASYTIPATTAAMNGYQYRAIFTNSVSSATSNAATLTVTPLPPANTAPVVTTQPASQTVAEGQAVTFSAAATGTPTPTVQWQQSVNNGSTFTNIAGATAASYTIPATTAAMNGYQYRAIFTNSVSSATSNAAILTVTQSSPWIRQDIGAVGVAGTSSFAAGIFTISGSGVDIWDRVDSFNYLYQPFVGDGQIVARVASLQNVDPWSKGGVMIRANLAANSPHAMMVLTPGNGAAFQRRKTAGALSLHTAGPNVVAPYWVKLVRSGNLFSGYISPDGQAWTFVGSDTVTMGSSVYVGLAITSGNNTKLCTATVDGLAITGPAPSDTTPPTVTAFAIPGTSASLTVPITTFTATDNVAVSGYLITESTTKPSATDPGWSTSQPASYTVTTAGSKTLYAWAKDAAGNVSDNRSAAVTVSVTLPSPWVQQDIGTVGVAGTASFAAGTYAISGSGIDIWDYVDSFHYLYQPLVGDGQIVARVASLQNVDPWSKGGVMIRATLASNSPHAMMVLTPGNGAAFQRRKTPGALSLHTAGPKVVAPYWVKLVRSGNVFTGYISPDGQTWTQVGSDTVVMGSSVYVGLAITSGNNTKLCAATADSLSISNPNTADTTPPTVTAFSIPATSSLTVPITTLTATDDVAVTGYLLTESATKPSAATPGWSAGKPTSYTFATAGSKTLYAWARDAAGNISDSRSANVVVTAAAGLTITGTVWQDMGSAGNSITSPAITTTAGNQLLVAFISASAPATGTNTAVTGVTSSGGLTWTRAVVNNAQRGTAEIWWAYAQSPVTAAVTATLNQSVSSGSVTVMSFSGTANAADAIGATGGRSAIGAPSASLVTTRTNSWVLGVGNDWYGAVSRTLGPNQTMVHQFLSTGTSDTYWVQRQNQPTAAAGTTVTINDTAPTRNMYNESIIEIRTP